MALRAIHFKCFQLLCHCKLKSCTSIKFNCTLISSVRVPVFIHPGKWHVYATRTAFLVRGRDQLCFCVCVVFYCPRTFLGQRTKTMFSSTPARRHEVQTESIHTACLDGHPVLTLDLSSSQQPPLLIIYRAPPCTKKTIRDQVFS